MALGEMLRTLRNLKGLTQAVVTKALGYKSSYYGSIESGQGRMCVDGDAIPRFKKLGELYGVEPSVLYAEAIADRVADLRAEIRALQAMKWPGDA